MLLKPEHVLSVPTTTNEIIQNYDLIRAKYLNAANGSAQPPQLPITDAKGFYLGQGAGIGQLQQRFAGIDKLFMTLVNGVLEDPDFALQKDPQVYKRMLRDPQIYYCMEVRKTATSSLPWQVVAPEAEANNPQAIELARQAQARLKQVPRMREFFNKMLEAILTGVTIQELCWSVSDATNEYIVENHYPVHKDRIKFTKDGHPQLLSPRSPTSGVALPPYKFITHTYNATDGSWSTPEDIGHLFFGKGLADTPLYHYFYFKMNALRFMLKTLERNSNPIKIYFTGPQNAELANKLDTILAALQNDAVVGIPGKKGDTDVDIVPGSGRSDLYMGLIDYIDRLITRAILGQELMTEMPAVGSYAAAQVHASVFAKIAETDKDRLEDTINMSLMAYDAQLNTPGLPEELRPQFRFKANSLVDVGSFLQTVQMAMDLGLQVSETQIRELSGLREPGPTEVSLNQLRTQAQLDQQAIFGMPGETEDEGNPDNPDKPKTDKPAKDKKDKDNGKAE